MHSHSQHIERIQDALKPGDACDGLGYVKAVYYPFVLCEENKRMNKGVILE